MLKVTLPSGIVVESDSAHDLKEFLDTLSTQKQKETINPDLSLYNDQEKIVSSDNGQVSVLVFEEETVQKPNRSEYPHNYATGKRGVNIGEREDQVLFIAKMFAEEAGNRSHQFRTKEIYALAENAPSMSTISSALQSLYAKRLVAHGRSRRRWWITERGWNSNYRIIAPMNVRRVASTI